MVHIRITFLMGLFFCRSLCAMSSHELRVDPYVVPEITPPSSPVERPLRNCFDDECSSGNFLSPIETPPLSARSTHVERARSSSLCSRRTRGAGSLDSCEGSERIGSGSTLSMEDPFANSSSSLGRVSSFSPDSSSSDEEDDSVLPQTIFKHDNPENGVCASQWQCWRETLSALWRVISNNCCLLPALAGRKPDRAPFQVVRAYYEHEMNALPDADILQGKGAYVFWDLRGSTRFYEECHDEGEKAARFMRQLTDYLYLPICEKYKMRIVGTGGDGPLLLRLQQSTESSVTVINDAVRASVELVARYPEVKERFSLSGPRWCGAGVDYGKFYLYLSPITKGLPPFIPSFVSKSVTGAFLCEQGNKEWSSALTISQVAFDQLHPEGLKEVFEAHKIKTKNGEKLPTYSASLSRLKRLYKRSGNKIFPTHKETLASVVASPLPEPAEQSREHDELVLEDV